MFLFIRIVLGLSVTYYTFGQNSGTLRNGNRLEDIMDSLQELQQNNNRDLLKLINVVNELENLDSKASDGQKAVAQRMIIQNMEEIKRSSAEVLKNAMRTNTYGKSFEVEKICDALSSLRSDPLKEIMVKIVDEYFDAMPYDKILDNLHSQKNVQQIIYGMVPLFRKLEGTGPLNATAVINFAESVKQLQDRDSYRTISTVQKDAVESIISKIPNCIKSICSEPVVCFYNCMDYVDGSPNARCRDSIVRWPGGYKVKRAGDKFYFEKHREYLWAKDVDYFNSTWRYVQHFEYKGEYDPSSFGNDGAWTMELNGDYFYLKNVKYGEYLFARYNRYYYGKVFYTWIPGTNVRTDEFRWQLKKCPKNVELA